MPNDDAARSGYSKEEEYFYKRNQALIERQRKALDAQRAAAAKADKGPHWMRCPKCGAAMVEVEMAHIKVDQCGGCQGLFFDSGELDILLQSQEPQGFVTGLRRLFR